MRKILCAALLATLAAAAPPQFAAREQSAGPPASPQATQQPAPAKPPAAKPAAPQAKPRTAAPSTTGAAVMTNRDIIQLVGAKVSDDIIIAKIKQSKTRFDTSTSGIIALKQAGVSDALIAVMVNAPSASASPPASAGSATTPASPKPGLAPGETASNASREVAATGTVAASRTAAEPAPAVITKAPPNYGMYIETGGELKPLGSIETKIQVSKFRSLLRSAIPFVRQKIDINVPGAHSTSRFEARRPNFYAFFPPSRDVSKFKLLQCKITGQNFDQRTVANASIMFSTEQNQDEVPVDIGPTSVPDLYKISAREDLTSGEFGFVEGNTGSKSASNIDIIDVYDFGIDHKEEKLALAGYLDTLPPAHLDDEAFLNWSKEDAKKIADDHEGNTGLTGSLLGWFKTQYASLDVYWTDPQFARAFARLEMLDRNLTATQTSKLVALLLGQTPTAGPDSSAGKYFILVSIGGKVGSGRLIGANEGERLMRPFDATLSNVKSKNVVPARKLEFIGGYAGVWKIEFDQQSIKGPVLNSDSPEVVFEARLNQNLDLKATFKTEKIAPATAPKVAANSTPANPR
jgi:hypothetical protein